VANLPAAGGGGRASTLEVRVGGELWTRVATLVTAGPTDRVYLELTEDDGGTVVQFGDGVTGARLPSGVENVTASYREGLGVAGLVEEDMLTLPLTRPPGLRGVTNPEPSADAAEPDAPDDIRRTAPLRIRTLDRVVSLRDYEDFTRAFAGIAKARATWSWDGRARGVFLTVAGPEGSVLDPAGTVGTALAEALRRAGDARVRLTIAPHRPALFVVEGRLRRDPALVPEEVDAALEAALRQRFGFAAREFGQPVAASEVLAAMHGVRGVAAVDLDRFERSDGAVAQQGLLGAALPAPGEAAPLGAELLLLDPRPLRFGSFA
jgi:predicted phage baseplate assembly protein